MRPLIRTARCCLLRARVRAMATLPMASPAAAAAAISSSSSSSSRPLFSSTRPNRLLLARFFPAAPAPAPAGARGLRTSAAAAASAVEVGGVKIARDDVVKEDDPTNNVPDTIFSKIGLQLHRRDNHPLGILKNTIYDYFDKNFAGQFDKFDDLCPLVSVKQTQNNFSGFAESTAEMLLELGRGLWDVAAQSLAGAEDSELARRLRKRAAATGERLSFMNEYLPEERDPVRCWLIVAGVAFVTLLVLGVGSGNETPVELPKKLIISPPSANRIQLPDGRYLAYEEQGVSADRARFSLIAPHSFLSSRLAGIPGISASLLEEFGARLVTYDLPGFGESDPHPGRNLNSSALDMLHLANGLDIPDKFWVVGYSGGGMHAWSALRYIPDRVAGAAMFAPMANPYDSKMTKDERHKTWDSWSTKRKLMHILARRFPSLLPLFYRRSFLSGKQGQAESWLSLSLGKKDKTLLDGPEFNAFWERNVAESVRQGDARPFVEEAVLQVSDWGFSLSDIQMQKKEDRGFFELIKSFFNQVEREWVGFLGPIHIWQGMDDRVVSPSVAEFVRRVVPGATVHKLLDEGHFSYFCFCDECHRQIFSTLFGIPQGPINPAPQPSELASELAEETTAPDNVTEQEQGKSSLA